MQPSVKIAVEKNGNTQSHAINANGTAKAVFELINAYKALTIPHPKIKDAEEFLKLKYPTARKSIRGFDDKEVINLLSEFAQSQTKQLKTFLDYCDEAGWIKNIDKQRIIKDFIKSL